MKIQVMARDNGWSPVQAKGYLDGVYSRRRGQLPSKYTQVGTDEYCLAFRAGYYGRAMPEGASSGKHTAPEADPLRKSNS